MARLQLLGLFDSPAAASDALESLRAAGVAEGDMAVLAGVPQRAEIVGRLRATTPVARIALLGAALGLLAGLTLIGGVFDLYPLHQGGQPVTPVPPSLIVLFETTMLGTMLATFVGLLLAGRLPNRRATLYDPRLTEGKVGVLVEADDNLADAVAERLTQSGAQVSRAPADAGQDRTFGRFWAGVVVLVLGVVVLGEVFAYNLLVLPIRDQMVEQLSVASQEGPRLAAPAAAVPVQGPVLVAGQPATQPEPVTADSLQRGKVLFGIHCALCHGTSGVGDGPLAKYFSPKPADLTGARVRQLDARAVFLAITEGRGQMPSLAENLGPGERWDVVGYVKDMAR